MRKKRAPLRNEPEQSNFTSALIFGRIMAGFVVKYVSDVGQRPSPMSATYLPSNRHNVRQLRPQYMMIFSRYSTAFLMLAQVAFAGAVMASPDDEPIVLRPFEQKGRETAFAGVHRVAFSPDGKLLACSHSAGYNGKASVRVYDLATRKLKNELLGHNSFVEALAFTDDSRKLASASAEIILVHDLRTAKHDSYASPQPESRYHVQRMQFVDAGKRLAIAAHWRQEDRTLKDSIDTWDFAAEKVISSIDAFGRMAISADGTLAAVSNLRDIKLHVWERATGNKKHAHDTPFDGGSSSIAFSPDGKTIGIDSGALRVAFVDVQSGKVRESTEKHSEITQCVVFSPNGKLLASCSDDKTVKLWNVTTAKLERTLTGHDGSVKCVAFSPDGKTLASASADGTLRLWKMQESQPVKQAQDK
jgi:WD40 repeat protein